jgi:putative protease
MRLYRNSDQAFERLLSKPSAERKIPVTMTLEATAGGFALTMDSARVEMEIPHQEAEKPQRDNIIRQLTKLGGTPYYCVDMVLPHQFNFFIPSSHLAELRRQVVALRQAQSFLTGNSEFPYGKHIVSLRETPPQLPPLYRVPYYYNIANSMARAFYEQLGLPEPSPAFAYRRSSSADSSLM